MKRKTYWIQYRNKKAEIKHTFIKAYTELEAEQKFYKQKRHDYDLIMKCALI